MRLQAFCLAVALILVPVAGEAKQRARAAKGRPAAAKKGPAKGSKAARQRSARARKARAVPVAPPAPVAWEPGPYNPLVSRRIPADEVKKRVEAGEAIVLIDTRSDFTGPMAKGAVRFTSETVAEWARNKPRDTFVVTYCTCHDEHTSNAAVLRLQQLGFTNAFALKGGLGAWQEAGLPTELPATGHAGVAP